VTVFVDTSALLAFLDADDALHPRAVAGQAAIRGEPLVTHGYIVVETLALIRRRLGAQATARFIDDMLPALAVEDPDASFRDHAIRSWRAALPTSMSFVDHVSFAFMRDRGLTRAWSLDADFVTAGFELVS